MAEDATMSSPEIVEIDAAKGPIIAKPTKAGGITVTMVFGMMLSTPP